MAIDDFTTCMTGRISTDVDTLKKLGEDEWKKLIDWWRPLSIEAKAVLGWLAVKAAEQLGKAIVAMFGLEVWEFIAAAAAGVGLGVLLDAATECAGQL